MEKLLQFMVISILDDLKWLETFFVISLRPSFPYLMVNECLNVMLV